MPLILLAAESNRNIALSFSNKSYSKKKDHLSVVYLV